MTSQDKVAVVVGAQGVIGRNLVEYISSLDGWRVVGLSRRDGEPSERVRHISVDLLDAADCREKLAAYKAPRAWTFVEHVQRSPSGKADYAWAKKVFEEY